MVHDARLAQMGVSFARTVNSQGSTDGDVSKRLVLGKLTTALVLREADTLLVTTGGLS